MIFQMDWCYVSLLLILVCASGFMVRTVLLPIVVTTIKVI